MLNYSVISPIVKYLSFTLSHALLSIAKEIQLTDTEILFFLPSCMRRRLDSSFSFVDIEAIWQRDSHYIFCSVRASRLVPVRRCRTLTGGQ